MAKGSTFKPRTKTEPKGSLRSRAVHTQKHFTQQQQVRGKEVHVTPKRENYQSDPFDYP